MSYRVENTLEELSYLEGARIEGVEIRPDEFDPETNVLVLRVRSKDAVGNQDGKVSDLVEVQVWQDEEGNGPGYLALTKVDESKRSARLTRELRAARTKGGRS